MAVQQLEKKATYLRVKVVDHAKEGKPAMNVKVPVSLVKFGLRMASAFAPEMKNVDIDWTSVDAMIAEGPQEVAHVDDEAEHKTIDVWLE